MYHIEEIPINKIEYTSDLSRLNDLDNLIGSILRFGLLEPIFVQDCGEKYKLIRGHRRIEACKFLGWTMIAALITKLDDDAERLILSNFITNTEQQNLTAFDEIRLLNTLYPRYTMSEISRMLQRSLTWVRSRLLIAKLPEEIQEEIRQANLIATDLNTIAKAAEHLRVRVARRVIHARKENRTLTGNHKTARPTIKEIDALTRWLNPARLNSVKNMPHCGTYILNVLSWAAGRITTEALKKNLKQ